jgi:hypothetical protein
MFGRNPVRRSLAQAVTAATLVVSFAVMGFLCCEREHAVEESHEDRHHHHHVLPDDAPAVAQVAPVIDLDIQGDPTAASSPDLSIACGVSATGVRGVFLWPIPPFLEYSSLLI